MKIKKDITMRKINEQKIARLIAITDDQLNHLDTVMDNVPGVVWEAWGNPENNNQKIDFVSNHTFKMLGYTIDEWLDNPNFWLKIIYPDDVKNTHNEAIHIFKNKNGGILQYRCIKKDGKIIWVESHVKVIKNSKGNPIGMCGVTMDISKIKELEYRKDEFISIVSHELKTPLTSIKGYMQIIERTVKTLKNDRVIELLGKMNTYVNKLSSLIADLLNASKIKSGKLEFNYHVFDYDEMIKETIDNIQETVNHHKIVINGQVNQSVYGDRNRIEQVLINLLVNAIKYSPRATDIEVFVEKNRDYIKTSIKDHGIGIPQGSEKKVFEKFFRANNAIKDYSGLGIGLYISSEIIKRHKGRIWVKGNDDRGSTFNFTLPLISSQFSTHD